MRGWAYANFGDGPGIYEVESRGGWNTYGDQNEQEYHDAVFRPVGPGAVSFGLISLCRWQFFATRKEAIDSNIRTMRRTVDSYRREIKNQHEFLKAKSKELAKLEALDTEPQPVVG
jgi:hypothetical protein